MKTKFKKSSLVLGGLLALSATGTTLAQSIDPAQALLNSSFAFNLGGFIYNTDISASLNGRSVNNPNVNFDETFGKDSDSQRIRLDGLWRITPAHHLRFEYFDNKTTRNRVLDKSIAWGDNTYNAGVDVQAVNQTKIAKFSYEYAFMHTPTYEVAGSVGVHYTDISLQLSGLATVTDANGNVSQGTFATKTGSAPLPLPLIGIRGAWAVSPKWLIGAHAQALKVKIEGYDGNWSDLGVSATWMYDRNFGLGLGYNRFGSSVTSTKEKFNGDIHMNYSGLQIFATGAF
jgi:hypothetical protein